MKISDLCSYVNGTVVCGKSRLGESVDFAFASDLMSDVLTVKIHNFILITGLANVQSIRTAEMSDAPYLLLCRNKEVTNEMLILAQENNITLIKSPYSLFKCAGILYSAGLKPVY
jgi:hypothetical protein